jgi:hypothetical protein
MLGARQDTAGRSADTSPELVLHRDATKWHEVLTILLLAGSEGPGVPCDPPTESSTADTPENRW